MRLHEMRGTGGARNSHSAHLEGRGVAAQRLASREGALRCALPAKGPKRQGADPSPNAGDGPNETPPPGVAQSRIDHARIKNIKSRMRPSM